MLLSNLIVFSGMTQLKFSKRFDMSQLPKDWQVFRVAVDWNGNPLLLARECKPPAPSRDASTEPRIGWINTPPTKAHHLIYWEGESKGTVTFEHSTVLFSSPRPSFHVQRFADGWLLCEVRGGRAVAYDGRGHAGRTFVDLGDASEDVQTTRGGQIWVSYFDEGAYGSGIGSQGAVCFDSSGHPIFGYFDFAKKHQLPLMDDCYSMNVVSEDEVWLSYYSAFPLVCIREFQLHRVWREFGCMGGAFGLAHDAVIFSKCYTRNTNEKAQLLRRALMDTSHSEPIEPIDEGGEIIHGPYQTASRGPSFYMLTKAALYEMSS
jgi:hypothetical protein